MQTFKNTITWSNISLGKKKHQLMCYQGLMELTLENRITGEWSWFPHHDVGQPAAASTTRNKSWWKFMIIQPLPIPAKMKHYEGSNNEESTGKGWNNGSQITSKDAPPVNRIRS
jgi:hypothetical protein